MQHDPPDGVGGQRAVTEELIERLVTSYDLILPVCIYEVSKALHWDRAVSHHPGEPLHHRVPRLAALPRGIKTGEVRVDVIEQPEALTGRGLVPDVVDSPGEVVNRQQVRAKSPRQQPQRNRKVLRGSLAR